MRHNWPVPGLAVALLVLTTETWGYAQEAGPPLPPLPHRILKQLHDDPAAWAKFRKDHAAVPPAPQTAPAEPQETPAPMAAPLAWVPAWPMQLSNPLLLTDGTVLAHVSCTSTWYRLTPNVLGSYAGGSWKKIAPMPAGYAPRFFSSAIMSDGRVLIEGGEYNGEKCMDVETNLGAIYNPQTDEWASVAPPSGWNNIGDGSGIVLANGKYLLSNAYNNKLATLDLATLTWTVTDPTKDDLNNEENWTLLPNGFVLTVEAYTNAPAPPCGDGAVVFEPITGTWADAGNTIHKLSGCSGSVPNFEAPTQILRPDATVAAFGATASTPAQNFPVYTAIYNTTSLTWTVGPMMPKVANEYYDMADAPAAILPDGTVLIAASPSVWVTNSSYPPPTHFFTFDGMSFTQVGDVNDSAVLSCYEMNFLELPSGNIFAVETDFPETEIFPASTNFKRNAVWSPAITSISSLTLEAGRSYSLTGKQLSGLTQGAVFGDDVQADTNFPLVQIVNTATAHVFYARTFGFSRRTVAPDALSSTSFEVPAGIETGPSSLRVIANGAASKAIDVTIQ
jgi:hypothetical protein